MTSAPVAFFERFNLEGLAKLPPTWAIIAAAIFILLLYILKLRRRHVEVSFSKLWARVLRDKEATSLWRHLKRLFSLLIMVAALSMLLGAIADPRDKTELKRGRHILILVDTSASMQARDGTVKKGEESKGPRTRLETAIEKARELIDKKARNDFMMIVRMESQVAPVTSWTKDKTQLLKGLGKLKAAETAADIGRALRFAADTLEGVREPLLILIGDGHYNREQLKCVFWGKKPPKGFHCDSEKDKANKKPKPKPEPKKPPMAAPKPQPKPTDDKKGKDKDRKPRKKLHAPPPKLAAVERFIDPIALGDIPVRAILVGKSANNLGIISFNARRDPSDTRTLQLFVKVKNYRKTRAKVNLLISSGAILPETIPLSIEPGATEQYIKKGLPAGGARMVGKLATPSGRGELDDFPLDDTAYALLPERKKLKVLMVSESGNLYIEGTLLLDENITYKRILPAAYTLQEANKHDVVIFDDFTPHELPKVGNFLLFDPRGPLSPIKIQKRVQDPLIFWPHGDKDKRHPVMEYIRMKDVFTTESSIFSLKPKDVPLVRLDARGPVYAALRARPGRRVIVVGFSAHQTNWVVQIGFPVFILNAMAYFAGDDSRLLTSYTTGRTWSIPFIAPGALADVQDPKGVKRKAPMKDGTVSFHGKHVGFYKITKGHRVRTIAANLADPEESNIAPLTSIKLGFDKHAQLLKEPHLKAEKRIGKTISTRSILFTVLLAGIGLVLIAFGLFGGRSAALWVFLGVLLVATAVLIMAFALDVRPWAALGLGVGAILFIEWLTYNRRVTV